MKPFETRLRAAVADAGSVLCVGLDPDSQRMPDTYRTSGMSTAAAVEAFCKDVIGATSEFCASYKPNLAFFEALGRDGLQVFGEVCDAVPKNRLVIADAKRGDIGNTASQYAKAFFEVFGCDAVTVSPLMGMESLEPFMADPAKGVYCLTLTSNPGAAEFLEQPMAGRASQALCIAEALARLDAARPGHAGMVIGATRPEAMAPLLAAHPAGSLLLPGVGAQGADVASVLAVLAGHPGVPVVPVSRGILFGQPGAAALRERADHFHRLLKPLAAAYV